MNPSPPSYADIRLKMHSLLRGRETVETLAAFFGADPRRLSIYPRFVRGHVFQFLDSNFAALKASLPEAEWKKLCLKYFEEHPPVDWRLWKVASAFPDFVESHEGREGFHAFHSELALFEWSEIDVYHASTPIPRPLDVDTPVLNPTLVALNFQYPTLRFIQAVRSGSDLKTEPVDFSNPMQKEQRVFLFLHPKSLKASHVPASENLLFAFKITHDGIPIQQAAKETGREVEVVQTLLRAAEKSGILILPEVLNLHS